MDILTVTIWFKVNYTHTHTQIQCTWCLVLGGTLLWAYKIWVENGNNQNCFNGVQQCSSNCSAKYQGSSQRMQRFHIKKNCLIANGILQYYCFHPNTVNFTLLLFLTVFKGTVSLYRNKLPHKWVDIIQGCLNWTIYAIQPIRQCLSDACSVLH